MVWVFVFISHLTDYYYNLVKSVLSNELGKPSGVHLDQSESSMEAFLATSFAKQS